MVGQNSRLTNKLLPFAYKKHIIVPAVGEEKKVANFFSMYKEEDV